uniref:polysaccharide pyruvyl transferase family protein n=1 Tax=Alistipes sp. TaxID=1872444 RepID=UPI004056E7D2
MKIGIITQPLVANYGGILQNFALQEVLRQLGHEARTIDYTLRNSPWRYLRHRLKHFILRKAGAPPTLLHLRPEAFERFVREHIALTERQLNYSPELISRYGFEALVVGSDQVWRPKYNRFLEDMFLRFALGAEGVKRVAYAASFGVDRWEFSPKQTRACAELAQRFDRITVREESGIRLCREQLKVEAECVLDPTLLLHNEAYAPLWEGVKRRSEPYLAAYLLGKDHARHAFCQEMATRIGVQLMSFGADGKATLSIEEWLATLNRAEIVITDSFHGTVFSILAHRPFFVLPHQGRGLSRIESLLKLVGLEERLLRAIPEEMPQLNAIDFSEVDRRLEEARSRSRELLRKALEE